MVELLTAKEGRKHWPQLTDKSLDFKKKKQHEEVWRRGGMTPW